MLYLGYLFSVGSLVCWIMTLIQMFKKESVLQGIIGIICGLWAFIWGWMNLGKTNQKGVMIAWTICIIAGIGINIMFAPEMALE